MQDTTVKGTLLQDEALKWMWLGIWHDANVIRMITTHAGAKGLAGCNASFFASFISSSTERRLE